MASFIMRVLRRARGIDLPMRLEVCGLSDKGVGREQNEDALYVIEHGRAVDGLDAFLAVADGTGGHPGASRASATAVETVGAMFAQSGTNHGSRHRTEGMLARATKEAVGEANRRILQAGRKQPDHRGRGTTLTIAAVAGRSPWWRTWETAERTWSVKGA